MLQCKKKVENIESYAMKVIKIVLSEILLAVAVVAHYIFKFTMHSDRTFFFQRPFSSRWYQDQSPEEYLLLGLSSLNLTGNPWFSLSNVNAVHFHEWL